MFSWATSRLESLAQTVAPPPTDPPSKFFYCCQGGDEDGALQELQQNPNLSSDPIHTIVHNARGQTPLHLACLYSMPRLLQHILQQAQQQLVTAMQVMDSDGNTPLHCACMSTNQANALAVVKTLVALEVDPSPVGAKNKMGQTPYDVATLNSIRQYLLPIQLQAETQKALDNGGAGLPPGIDLGGLRIKNSHLPPPPVMGGMPPSGGGGGAPAAAQSAYPPIPGLPQQQQHQPSSSPAYPPTPGLPQQSASAYPPTPGMPQQSQEPSPGPVQQSEQQSRPQFASPSIFTTPSPQQQPTHSSAHPSDQLGVLVGEGSTAAQPQPSETVNAKIQQQQPFVQETAPPANATKGSSLPQPPVSNGGGRPPSAPTSTGSQHSYALRGQSSAAILNKSKYQPDGFHSSSSDKNLQEKYGHINNAGSGRAAVPPPPSSGNSAGVGGNLTAAGAGLLHPQSAPSSFGAAGGGSNNPYAGGHSALGAGARARRYVTYDPITGAQRVPLPTPPSNSGGVGVPRSGNAGMMLPTPPLPSKNFSTFTPTTSAPVASDNGQQSSQTASGGVTFMTNPADQQQKPGAVSTTFPSPPQMSTYGKTPMNTPISPALQGPQSGPPSGSSPFLPPPPYQQRSGAAMSKTSPTAAAGNAVGVFGSMSSPGTAPSPVKPAIPSPVKMSGSGVGSTGSRRYSESSTSDPAALFAKPAASDNPSDSRAQRQATGAVGQEPKKSSSDMAAQAFASQAPPGNAVVMASTFSASDEQQPAASTDSSPRKQSASELFSAGSLSNQESATTAAAATDAAKVSPAELFNGTPSNQEAATAVAADTTKVSPSQLFNSTTTNTDPAPPAPEEDQAVTAAIASDEEDLHDVPLTPGDETKKPAMTTQPAATTVEDTNSLISAIGMPPPPFSKKK